MKTQTGVYKIVCLATGQVYIGVSGNIYMRYAGHKSDLAKGKHSNIHLQAYYNVYGLNQIALEVLEECQLDKTVMIDLEAKYLEIYKGKLLNIKTSKNGNIGFLPKETKEKLAIRRGLYWKRFYADYTLDFSLGL